jgi:starch synthase
MYHNDKKAWRQLIRTGMRQDWSWTKSAGEYVQLYERTIERRKGYRAE